MIRPQDVVDIRLDAEELDYVRQMAKLAEIGGISHIRKPGERRALLPDDQFVGQACTYAFAKHWCGCRFPEMYAAARAEANRHPTTGDGGHDILGLSLDVKGSLMRSQWRKPVDYRLSVREWRANWTFVLALVENHWEQEDWRLWTEAAVHLVGWATTEMLPPETSNDPLFKGAHVLFGYELLPIAELPVEVL